LGENGNPDQNGDDSGDFSSWYNGEAGTGIPRHWFHNIGQWLADDNYQPWTLMRDSFSQVREFLNAKGLHDIMWSDLIDTPYGKGLHNVINELLNRPDYYYPSKVNIAGKYGSGDWNEWWHNRGNNLSVWHSHASEHALTYVIPIMKVMYDMTLEVFKKITQQIQATLLKAELIVFIKNTNYTFSRNAQKKIKRGDKMKLVMYSIYDEAMQEYGPIMQAKNDEVAIRQFHSVLENVPKNCKFDYKLYKIGVFDTEDGLVESYGATERTLLEVIK